MMTVSFAGVGAIVAPALLMAAPVFAQDAPPRLSLGVTGGTLGIGPEAGLRFNRTVGVRASAAFLDFSHEFDVDDIDYDGRVKLESYGAMVDIYPTGSGLRVSGGVRVDRNRVNVTAAPTGNVTVGDISFTPEQIGTLRGHADADDVAPLVTIGYAGGLTRGIKFGVDGGVMFHGRPQVRELTADGSFAANPVFQEELAKERVKLSDDVDGYRIYPVLQFSIFYAF